MIRALTAILFALTAWFATTDLFAQASEREGEPQTVVISTGSQNAADVAETIQLVFGNQDGIAERSPSSGQIVNHLLILSAETL